LFFGQTVGTREKVAAVKLARFFTAALLTGHALVACGRPKAPTITPEKGELTAIGPDGIHLLLHLNVENPNRFDLAARSVTARVVLDGKHEVGSVALSQPFQLPARQVTRLSVPTTLALRDVPVVLALAASSRDVTYDANGTVNIGGDSLNVNLPFHLSGALTHQQLLQATMNSLPRLP
jgi:LEA14-like dessication related protein